MALTDLTHRERQVLQLMAEGHTSLRIGHELGTSEDTVRTQRIGLFRKLGARNAAHAVSLGYAKGLLSGATPRVEGQCPACGWADPRKHSRPHSG